MILNPNKFQIIIIHHTLTIYTKQMSNIDVKEIKSLNSVRLLGIEITSRLIIKYMLRL